MFLVNLLQLKQKTINSILIQRCIRKLMQIKTVYFFFYILQIFKVFCSTPRYDLMLLFESNDVESFNNLRINGKFLMKEIDYLQSLTCFINDILIIHNMYSTKIEYAESSRWYKNDETKNIEKFFNDPKTWNYNKNKSKINNVLIEAINKIKKPTIIFFWCNNVMKKKEKGIIKIREYLSIWSATNTQTNIFKNFIRLAVEKQAVVYPILAAKGKHHVNFLYNLASYTNGKCLVTQKYNFYKTTRNLLLNLFNFTIDMEQSVYEIIPKTYGFNRYREILSVESSYLLFKNPEILHINNSLNQNVLNKKLKGSIMKRKLVHKKICEVFDCKLEYLFFNNPIFVLSLNIFIEYGNKMQLKTLEEKIKKSSYLKQTIDAPILNKIFFGVDIERNALESLILSYDQFSGFYIFKKAKMSSFLCSDFFLINSEFIFKAEKVLQSVQTIQSTRMRNTEYIYIPKEVEISVLIKLFIYYLFDSYSFQTRFCMIIAAICYIYVPLLREKAQIFLQNNRGKWIDYDLEENTTFEFIKLFWRVREFSLVEQDIACFMKICPEFNAELFRSSSELLCSY